jgi:membrane protease YdiL (CAAX protease family)
MLLAAAAVYLIAMILAGWFVGVLAQRLGWPPQDFSRFAALRGDPGRLVLWLVVAWSTAAIGEELVFRGFLMSRLLSGFGGSSAASAAAVLVQAALFAAGHAYLGVRGVAAAIAVGLVFGTAWLLNGRQLAPLVAAHGVIDTISLIGIFAGRA